AFIHHTNLEAAERDSRKLVCYDCGVACDLSAMRKERLVYLTRLGAKSPRVVEPKRSLPVVSPPPPPPPVAIAGAEPDAATVEASVPKKKGPRPPPRIVQGEARRYRFAFAKVGPMAF